MSEPPRSRSQIPFYYPNLIGYVRIILAIAAVGTFQTHPWTAASFYAVSQLLDAVDGHVARMFGQASLMGAVLDQLTDRMSTVGIFLLLAARYPNWTSILFVLCVCDMAGHWCYTHAQALKGSASHKQVPFNWQLLKWYYTNRDVMFCCHLSYETFLCSLLVASHLPSYSILMYLVRLLTLLSFPLAVIKMITNGAQIFLGGALLVDIEESRKRATSA